MKIIALLSFTFYSMALFCQTSDNSFKKPLSDVISEIENRYKVKIRYPADLIKDKMITFADWRFRPDVEVTMTNIFASQDITFSKEAENKYKLQAFQYHLKTPQEGKEQLLYFSTLYNNLEGWQKRSSELQACILRSLLLSPIPANPSTAPIISNFRKKDGYTVENIALEVLPGLYVCGSLYKPFDYHGKIPVILNPDGHFDHGRYRADCQLRCAMEAKMGAMAFSYDLFAWGESLLQFKTEDHRRALAQTIQALNAIRILDYLLSLKDADPSRVAITGGSGGGSNTMLVTAIDNRITLSVPVVMLSSYHSGGCPCESGMGIHLCGGGTNNVEIAGMAAPRPQLIISDGKDWTQHVPETEFPYLQKIYAFYGKKEAVQNAHFPEEGHDYGLSKRLAMYQFVAHNFNLDLHPFMDINNHIIESGITIEKESELFVFGPRGEHLPANAIKSFDALQKFFDKH